MIPDLLIDLLRDLGRSVNAPPESDEESHRRARFARLANAEMAKEKTRAARLRNTTWAVGGGIVAAAAVLLALWIPKTLSSGDHPESSNGKVALEAGPLRPSPAARGPRATVPGATVSGATVSGATVSGATVLGSGAELVRSEDAHFELRGELRGERRFEVIQLNAGEVSLSVPKLGKTEGLAVVTPEARVEVRGTEFTVQRNQETEQTTVRVREGIVSVASDGSEVLLHPGETWTSASVSSKAPGSTLDASAPPVSGATNSGASLKGTSAGAMLPMKSAPALEEQARSELAEQTRLYQAAMVAKRHGLNELAEKRLEELAERFPASPLLPSVQRELEKLKAGAP